MIPLALAAVHRERRVAVRCQVELVLDGRLFRGESEDLSSRGLFVRTEERLPLGAVAAVRVALPDGSTFQADGRIAHTVSAEDAREIGRAPGIGIQYVGGDALGRERLEELLRACAEPPAVGVENSAGASVLLASASERLLERLANALTSADFKVAVATSGADAYAACLHRPPDLIIADVDLAGMDGWHLARTLSSKVNLSHLPVILVTDRMDDFRRLDALRVDLADCLEKPFTDEEVCLRVRRVLRQTRPAEWHTLRGRLRDISLATLFSLFEYERTSGILILRQRRVTARVFVSEGRITQVDSHRSELSTAEQLIELLDWEQGEFEFSSCEVVGGEEGIATTQLLLEHARSRDESGRVLVEPRAAVDEEEMALRRLFPEAGTNLDRDGRYRVSRVDRGDVTVIRQRGTSGVEIGHGLPEALAEDVDLDD